MAITMKQQAQQRKASSGDVAVPMIKGAQVEQATSRLEAAVGALHETLTTLENELAPILGCVPPSLAHGESSEELVPLAEVIRNRAISVETAVERIGTLLERLELGHF